MTEEPPAPLPGEVVINAVPSLLPFPNMAEQMGKAIGQLAVDALQIGTDAGMQSACEPRHSARDYATHCQACGHPLGMYDERAGDVLCTYCRRNERPPLVHLPMVAFHDDDDDREDYGPADDGGL